MQHDFFVIVPRKIILVELFPELSKLRDAHAENTRLGNIRDQLFMEIPVLRVREHEQLFAYIHAGFILLVDL